MKHSFLPDITRRRLWKAKNQSHLMPLSQAEVQLCSFKYTILALHKKATCCAFESIIDRMIQNKHWSQTK